MSIGERIKEARKKAGLKQSELAEKLGVAVITIGQYERGVRQPRLEQFQRIAAILNVDVNWLMNGQTIEQRDQAMKDHVARRFAEAEAGLQKKRREQLNAAFDRLNQDGQGKAVERVEELTEIPKYQRGTAPKLTPAPLEGKDTASASGAPETPPEGPPGGQE